jgi:hypothetical protein
MVDLTLRQILLLLRLNLMTARRFHYVAYVYNKHRRKNLAQLLSTEKFKHVAISWDVKS